MEMPVEMLIKIDSLKVQLGLSKRGSVIIELLNAILEDKMLPDK